jgi:hypothetical protein
MDVPIGGDCKLRLFRRTLGAALRHDDRFRSE